MREIEMIVDPDGTTWRQLDLFRNAPGHECRFCGFPCEDATDLCNHILYKHARDSIPDRAHERCVPNGFHSKHT